MLSLLVLIVSCKIIVFLLCDRKQSTGARGLLMECSEGNFFSL